MVIRHRWSHSAEEVNWGAAFGRTWHGNDVDSCAREDSGLVGLVFVGVGG